MQRPAEMPASLNPVSVQLLKVTELTLVQTPQEESKGHTSAKGTGSAAPARNTDTAALQTAGISGGKEGMDTVLS